MKDIQLYYVSTNLTCYCVMKILLKILFIFVHLSVFVCFLSGEPYASLEHVKKELHVCFSLGVSSSGW